MAPKHLPSFDEWLTRPRPDSTARVARGSTLPSLDDYLAKPRPDVAKHEWPEGDPHYGEQEEAPRSFFAERFPKARQALYGVVDSGLRLGEGLAQNAANVLPGNDPFQRASDFIERKRKGMEERTAPTDTGEMVSRVAGNIVGEGAQYVAGGAAGRKLAGPVVQKIGERIAPRLTAKLVGSKGVLSEAAKDAAAVAPVDLAVTAVGPENSTLGAIAALTKDRYAADDTRLRAKITRGLSGAMEAAAENPATRFAGEVLIGGSADVALRGTARALRGAPTAPVAERVAPLPDLDIPEQSPEMATKIREAYGPGTWYPKSAAEIHAEEAKRGFGLRGPGAAREAVAEAVPEAMDVPVDIDIRAPEQEAVPGFVPPADDITARRVGMPDDLKEGINLLAEEAAYTRSVSRPGQRVRYKDYDANGKEVVHDAEVLAYDSAENKVAVKWATDGGEMHASVRPWELDPVADLPPARMEPEPVAASGAVAGASLPEIPAIIARTGVGATVGGLAAPEGEKLEGMAAGAAVGLAGPAALRGAKKLGRGGFAVNPLDDYRGQHGAPLRDGGAPLHDLTGGGSIYPDDVYTHGARYYGTGDDALDHRAFAIADRARGNPTATVTVYRAVPDDLVPSARIQKLEREKAYILKHGKVPADVDAAGLSSSAYYDKIHGELETLRAGSQADAASINPGDWVSITRKYAEDHGRSALRGRYAIVSKKVKASDIFTNGDSIHEWGYDPAPTKESGAADPALVGLVGRTAVGATAGAVVAPEDQKGMGALAGAAVLGGGPVALKKLAGPGVVKGASRFASDPNVAAVRAMRQKAAPSTVSLLARLKADKTRPLRRLRQGVTRAVAGLERYGEIVGGTDELARVAAKGRGWLPSSEMYAVENLSPVVRKVEAAGREDVSDLLIAERDIELRANGYGQKTPVSDAELQAAVQKLSAVPEIRAAADEVRAYFRTLLEAKRDNGVITPQQFQDITDKGQHYVPFVRDMEERISQAGGTTKYNRSTGVRKMKKEDVVADLAIMDPLEMALLDTHETTRRIHKARVTNLVAKIAEQNPTEAAAFLRELPERPEGILPKTSKEGVLIDPIVNGERKYYEVVDEELADAFASLTPTGQTALVGVLSSVAGVMRTGVVLHPAFAVANALRDLGFTALSRELPGGTKRAAASAAVGAGVGAAVSDDPLDGALLGATVAVLPFGGLHLARMAAENTAALKDILGPTATGAVLGGTTGALSADDEGESATLRFVVGALAGAAGGKLAGKMGVKKSGAYERFMAGGGGQFGFFGNRGEKDAAKLIGRMAEGGDVLQPRSIGELVNWISHAVETAPRLAYYKRTGDIPGARDLSLDFAVRGSSRSVSGLTKSTAFLNPALQGVDKWTRMLGKPNTYAVGLAAMTAPAIALYELNKDNPEYQNIPLYQKALYYHIPKPDGGFFKVPKPFEPGALFGTAPEMARSYLETGDKEALKATGTVLARQYGPESFLPIPTALAGPFEAFVNYDMFRRRSIDPNPWSDIDPAYQYDERTSTVALALNKVPGLGGVSPARIDHVLQSLTGTLGRDVADKITEAARVAGLDERREPAGRALQVMSRFHSSEGGVGEIEIAWRRKLDKGGRAYNTVKKLINDGQEAEAKKYLADNREAVAEYLRYKDVDKFLSLVSKTRGTIYDSDAEREEKTRLLGNLNRAVAEMLRSPTAKNPTARLAGASK